MNEPRSVFLPGERPEGGRRVAVFRREPHRAGGWCSLCQGDAPTGIAVFAVGTKNHLFFCLACAKSIGAEAA